MGGRGGGRRVLSGLIGLRIDDGQTRRDILSLGCGGRSSLAGTLGLGQSLQLHV